MTPEHAHPTTRHTCTTGAENRVARTAKARLWFPAEPAAATGPSRADCIAMASQAAVSTLVHEHRLPRTGSRPTITVHRDGDHMVATYI